MRDKKYPMKYVDGFIAKSGLYTLEDLHLLVK